MHRSIVVVSALLSLVGCKDSPKRKSNVKKGHTQKMRVCGGLSGHWRYGSVEEARGLGTRRVFRRIGQ